MQGGPETTEPGAGGTNAHASAAAEMATRLVDVLYALELAPTPRFTYVSPSVTALVGYTPEDHYADPELGMRLLDPRDLPTLLAATEAPGDEPIAFTVRWIARDGREVWTEHRCTRVVEADGRVMLFGAARNVTEQIRSRERLESERERYRLLAESTHDVVLRTDAEGRISWASPSTTAALGWEASDVVGRTVPDLIHPADLEGARAKQQRILDEGGTPDSCELRVSVKGGDWKWMRVTQRVLTDDSGARIGGIEEMQDIQAEVETRAHLVREVDHDALTRVAGLSLGLARIREMLDHGRQANWALLCAGVNGLTGINQAFTHLAGDRVLQEIAQRLVAAAGASDRVARIAGDEFAVLLPEVHSTADAAAAAERLLGAVAGPVSLGPNELDVTISVGIAAADGHTAEELVRDATIAMRQARSRGTHTWDLLDPVAADEAKRTLSLQAELRDALANGEIHAWFQPIVRLADRSVAGYEALVRWVKPDGTVLPPAEFLPAATSSPLILGIDRVVIDHSLALLGRLPREQFIAINVDASCLSTSALRHRIRTEITRLAIDPRRVELEVTETLLITALTEVLDNMKDLDDLGVSWWVDDFGTGYSSIAHLKDMPISGLKLDRTFTAGVDQGSEKALSLAQGLAGLARGLGLMTTAEGIETVEQANILRAAGWEFGQGWLFGRPVPPEQIPLA